MTSFTWLASSPSASDSDVVSTIDGDSGTATGSNHNIDILGTANEITTTGSGNDITISLANKTSYASIHGSAFQPNDSTIEVYYSDGGIEAQGAALGGTWASIQFHME